MYELEARFIDSKCSHSKSQSAADCAAASVRIFTYIKELNGFHHLVPKIFFAKSEKIFVVPKHNPPSDERKQISTFFAV